MAEPPTHDMAGCSFTCPLTCTGPGDIDHESEADRRARLGAIGRTLDSEGVCTRCGCPDLHCCCPAVVPNIVPDGFWSKTPDDYEAYAIRQANARILAEAEVERLKIDNDQLEDDLLTMLKVRNEALRQAACEVIVGPDGQDDLDRSRLIAKWLEEAYAELGIADGEPLVPVVQPKESLLAWAAETPHTCEDTQDEEIQQEAETIVKLMAKLARSVREAKAARDRKLEADG